MLKTFYCKKTCNACWWGKHQFLKTMIQHVVDFGFHIAGIVESTRAVVAWNIFSWFVLLISLHIISRVRVLHTLLSIRLVSSDISLYLCKILRYLTSKSACFWGLILCCFSCSKECRIMVVTWYQGQKGINNFHTENIPGVMFCALSIWGRLETKLSG